MAWRDSRRNRGRLSLFISSIVLGIAALVAINSFSENLQKDINNEAKSLLGTDLLVDGNQAVPDSLMPFLDSLDSEARARAMNFVSMVYFPKNGGTRLAQVKAMEGDFPFYGKLLTDPLTAKDTYQDGKTALVDKTLMFQFGLEPGDSIQIGGQMFKIEGQLVGAPGRAGIAGTIAPVVYMPMQYLKETGLVQEGSRIFYQYYFKFSEETDVEKLAKETVKPRMSAASFGIDTVEERKEEMGKAFSQMAVFLNLIGFIALLLGCIGVASSVHIYIKDKISTIAIMRCLGAKGTTSFWIYMIQVLMLGLIGGVIGAALGSVIQVVLPLVIGEFLPLENVSNDISPSAIAGGIVTGLGITVLFAMLPLLAVRNISPLRTLRASYDDDTSGRDPLQWLVYLAIFLFMFGFAYWQTGDWKSFVFPIAIGVGFGVLWGIAKLLTWSVRRFFPTKASYVLRQSVANLYRPNNQTVILVVTIGLGALLITLLFFMRDTLLNQVQMTGTGGQPNMIVFDIQTPQREAILDLAKANDMPVIQDVPVVTMRLDNIDGKTKDVVQADSTSEVEGWVFRREWRCTYRDTLTESETIMEGEFVPEVGADGIIYISISDNVADGLNAEIGTNVTFNVQGALIETEVGSIREIEFGKLQTNFFVVFPKGVLEQAPQFHVMVSRTVSEEQSAGFQQALVKGFPNASVIDLTQILQAVEDILGKVTFVIRFMALFSILTGLLVLISSVVLSKFQRIQESVLLRTLGASRSQILWINALEYFFLGSLATLTGIGLAVIAGWLQAKFMLDTPFVFSWIPTLTVFFAITGLTVFIGMFNSREVLSKPPLEVLRKEVG
ncbi:MAG: putative ABC transport system permease protein [Paraglaciecola sp.]|jgi:putative ABC transport system permease protein